MKAKANGASSAATDFLLALMVLVALLLGFLPGRSQTVGSTTPVTGVTNFPVLSGTTPITNFFANSLPAKAVTASGIANTNAWFSYTYVLTLPGYTNGLWTNQYPIGGFTNNFLAGTNGGSWSTNFSGYTNIAFPVILQINTGTNTINFYVP